MTFKTYAYTNQGSRSNNEDYCLCEDSIWVLADGLGGHDSGEVASKTACEGVCELWKENEKDMSNDAIISLAKRANALVFEKQSEEGCESMRTTLVLAVTDGDKVKATNVGDSRLYYFRDNKVFKQTRDHSVSALSAQMGDIDYSEIRFNEDRNKLLKVLGDKEILVLKDEPIEVTATKGDAFLLCSDGFWEYVYEQEMEIDLIKSTSPKEWMEYMVKRILLATKNESNDNFTAICVMVE